VNRPSPGLTVIVQLQGHPNMTKKYFCFVLILPEIDCLVSSVAEPHHFYAAPAPGKIFDAALALALAPTLLYSEAKFLK
jgi:hypothetical protein